jgi:hypothetical protein
MADAGAAVTQTVTVKMPDPVIAHGWRFLNGMLCLGSTRLQPEPEVLSKIWTNPALYGARQLPSDAVDQQASKGPTPAGEILIYKQLLLIIFLGLAPNVP